MPAPVEKWKNYGPRVEKTKKPLFSEGEKKVLAYFYEGYNRWKIAELMNLSLSTVATHIDNVYSKLHSIKALPYRNEGPDEYNMGRLLLKYMIDHPEEWQTDDPK